MNKKLTTIILAVLLILIGKVDAATLTQKVGGSYISATLEAGQHVKLNFINQANYTFTNWTVESGNVTIDTTNPNVTFIMPNNDVVIRGNYLEEVATPQNYSITYNANGGTGSMTAQTVTAGQTVILTTNTFTRNGYAFKGWSTNAAATTATYTDGQSITPTADMTLYAVWGTPEYTLTYNANGGSGAPAAQTGTTLTISSTTPTYSGHTFLGWSTSSSATSATYTAGGSIRLTANTTLYAVWQIEGYTLTYDANGGSVAPASQTGTTLTISSTAPTRSGYTFLGWSEDSSATTATYTAGGSITLTADTTLYAVWEQITYTLTLTYDANGGSNAPSAQSYTSATTSYTFTISTEEPTPPSGKAFRGWAISSSATVADYKIGASIEISEDTTLYAVYITPLSSGASFTGSDVGAYVTYTPSETSYTVSGDVSGYGSDQTYNPSSATNWRVFSNDGTNVEIISDESVGTLYLRGSTGYTNAVQTLQDMTAAYVNSTYATSARSLGYSESGLTETEIANYKTIDTATYPIEYGISDTAFPYYDKQYSADKTVISNNGSLKQNSGYVWLASRDVYTLSSISNFYVRNMSTSGGVHNYSYRLCRVDSGGSTYTLINSYGVRPVVSLKSGLTVASGDGSPSNPYVLEKIGYTLTYDANGGSNPPSSQSYTGTDTSYSFTISTDEPIPPTGKAFRGWATSSSATVADYKIGASIEISEDTTLYAVYVTPLTSGDSFTGADVGAYVTYIPSSTSYTVSTDVSGYDSDQTYNPSSATNWRVFSNDGTNIEIISDESVGDLYLAGSTGYVNAVQTLQNISNAYVNSIYTTSARSFGYSESGLTDVENYKIINTGTYPVEQGVGNTFPYSDSQYSADRAIIKNNKSLRHNNNHVWVASRFSYDDYFYVDYLSSTGVVSQFCYLYYWNSYGNDWYSRTWSNGVRPIVTLKSGLTVAGGDGSPSNPYIMQ